MVKKSKVVSLWVRGLIFVFVLNVVEELLPGTGAEFVWIVFIVLYVLYTIFKKSGKSIASAIETTLETIDEQIKTQQKNTGSKQYNLQESFTNILDSIQETNKEEKRNQAAAKLSETSTVYKNTSDTIHQETITQEKVNPYSLDGK